MNRLRIRTLFLMMFAAALAFAPGVLIAKQSQLAPQDIDFNFDESQNKLRVNVALQRPQWERIYDREDSKVEIRFYSGDKKGQARRIMKGKDYYLPERSPVSNWTFSDEACPKPGRYWGKIWLSVRNRDGKPNDDFKPFEQYYPYTCVDLEKAIAIDVDDVSYNESDSDKDGKDDQLNVVIDVDERFFNRVEKADRKIEVRLYAERDGQKVRIRKDKTYLMPNHKPSYTYPLKALCGDMSRYWPWEEKPVEVSFRLTVVEQVGNDDVERDKGYKAYYSKSHVAYCQNEWW